MCVSVSKRGRRPGDDDGDDDGDGTHLLAPGYNHANNVLHAMHLSNQWQRIAFNHL